MNSSVLGGLHARLNMISCIERVLANTSTQGGKFLSPVDRLLGDVLHDAKSAPRSSVDARNLTLREDLSFQHVRRQRDADLRCPLDFGETRGRGAIWTPTLDGVPIGDFLKLSLRTLPRSAVWHSQPMRYHQLLPVQRSPRGDPAIEKVARFSGRFSSAMSPVSRQAFPDHCLCVARNSSSM